PTLPIDAGQGLQLAAHGGLGARAGLRGGGDVDVAEDGAGRRREQGEEQQRQPEGRPTKEGGEAHQASSRYPAPRTVCSMALSKPLSILARRRLMWTSMTLVWGSK